MKNFAFYEVLINIDAIAISAFTYTWRIDASAPPANGFPILWRIDQKGIFDCRNHGNAVTDEVARGIFREEFNLILFALFVFYGVDAVHHGLVSREHAVG